MFLYCASKPTKKQPYGGLVKWTDNRNRQGMPLEMSGDTEQCCAADGNKIVLMFMLCGLNFILFAWWFNK